MSWLIEITPHPCGGFRYTIKGSRVDHAGFEPTRDYIVRCIKLALVRALPDSVYAGTIPPIDMQGLAAVANREVHRDHNLMLRGPAGISSALLQRLETLRYIAHMPASGDVKLTAAGRELLQPATREGEQ